VADHPREMETKHVFPREWPVVETADVFFLMSLKEVLSSRASAQTKPLMETKPVMQHPVRQQSESVTRT